MFIFVCRTTTKKKPCIDFNYHILSKLQLAPPIVLLSRWKFIAYCEHTHDGRLAHPNYICGLMECNDDRAYRTWMMVDMRLMWENEAFFITRSGDGVGVTSNY